MKYYIGIDQSLTSTGYCVLDAAYNIIEYGVFNSSMDDGDDHSRIHIIISNIMDLYNRYTDATITLESLSYGSIGNATRKLAGLLFVIIDRLKYDLHVSNINFIAPTTLKKYATNNGKASKKEMFDSLDDSVQTLFKSSHTVSKGRYDIVDAYYLAKINIK